MPEMSRSVIEGHEIAGLVNPGMAKKIPDFICHALGVHKLGGDAALISVAGDKIDVVVERGEGSVVTPIMVQRQAEVGKAGGDEGTTQVAAIGRGGAGKAFVRVDVVTVAEIGEVDTEGLGVGREELLEGFSLHAEDLPGELDLENGLIGVDVGISLGVGAACDAIVDMVTEGAQEIIGGIEAEGTFGGDRREGRIECRRPDATALDPEVMAFGDIPVAETEEGLVAGEENAAGTKGGLKFYWGQHMEEAVMGEREPFELGVGHKKPETRESAAADAKWSGML